MSQVSLVNDPSKAGRRAGKTRFIGEASRYAVFPVHTRFDAICWFVTDAERQDEYGFAEVVRQCDTFEEAIKGL